MGGTGVAPFRGFLQERRHRKKAQPGMDFGRSWLFFGCRSDSEDFLFKSDLQKFCEDGTLDKLDVAFSRVMESKVYVQDKMREHAIELKRWILTYKARVYVCGDGAHMAKDVHEALIDVLSVKEIRS